ncbi:hypothetical protein [Luteimonas wenzhouensis]|uniref:Transmembrane protein n=1 Tax=Luteimonas wenzhouensis TaxID=2599615 RepID=A0A5C5U6U7_9GAMM|nr:hypothetical protein [Luteimonas wenzhouensis]NLW96721.1 hypothetical protein [Xanthomonadaceae bacterium]TWT21606.1 hypothetical protein FQY79_00225 [Luteimonas wenzhouensis]
MNLPLHLGWLGVLEATLIAFAVGVLCLLAWRWIALRAGWPQSRAIGWACVCAVAIAAGIDSWNLFYLGVVRLESPLYARIALAKMHDADSLGTRVFMEWCGALAGVVAGWVLARGRGPAPGE